MSAPHLSPVRAAEILRVSAGLPLVVVGDVMLDHTVRGDVHRISPEAPVPVVSVDSDHWVPGGAANVALNLVALGARAELCGRAGRDDAAKRLVSSLKDSGVRFRSTDWCRTGVATIEKSRVVVRGQQLCRLDREGAPELYALGKRDEPSLARAVSGARALVLSDYAKGVLNPAGVEFLLAEARRKGLLVAVDAKPGHELPLAGVDVFKCNRREALAFAGISERPHQLWPAAEVCRRIHERFRPVHLVITLGPEGMLIASGGKVKRALPTIAREVFDVCGAGDTAIAALTLALASGAPIEEAVLLANAASAVVVAKSGTATASPAEVVAALGG